MLLSWILNDITAKTPPPQGVQHIPAKTNYRAFIKFSWIAILALQGMLALCMVPHVIESRHSYIFGTVEYVPVDLLGLLIGVLVDGMSMKGALIGVGLSTAYVALNALCIARRRVILPIISLVICGGLLGLLLLFIIQDAGRWGVSYEGVLRCASFLWPYFALFAVTLIGVVNIFKERRFLKDVSICETSI
ncbi:MAG: hypothetical protein LBS74_00395 [Oscillospiraceae bacterium]|jgi:hypothetical protein|nr:hypothetical protein [Oscillospiraceae bacterium]